MTIDCDRCAVRGAACVDCAVTFIADTVTFATEAVREPREQSAKPPVITLDAAETRALTALANAGMIPPLRYAPRMAKAS
jgi:hypothetical protein